MNDEQMKQYKAQFTKEQLLPTPDRLKEECRGAAGTLGHVWDGEVEVLVAMRRKGDKQVQWATTVQDRESIIDMTRKIFDSSAFMKFLIKRDETVYAPPRVTRIK